ncbi:MAG: nucleoside hydrolase [Acidimicrobiia bacterium]|nr:nucleoside hydrolase [Acidimicrobiia bacterium]MDH5292176.1 nucleoside hydrolase [Acidimicrobiia bacterium]
MPTPIILDCDPGHDDAIAILLALASPELDLVGITTVAGNTTVDKTTVNALRVLAVAGRPDVPVAAGADRPLVRGLHVAEHIHGVSGLDGPEVPEAASEPVPGHAVEAMAGWLAAAARPVTLVPTGPLTNIALLLERHPQVRPSIERIVLMGGSIGLGNVTPSAEFNIWVDPDAAAAVFGSGLDVTMVGLDVTHHTLLSVDDSEVLRASGSVGRFVAELTDFFRARYARIYGDPIAPIHDAAAVAHVIDPTIIKTRRLNVEVETASPLTVGRTVVDLMGVSGRSDNAWVGVTVEGRRFSELLVDRLTGLDGHAGSASGL